MHRRSSVPPRSRSRRPNRWPKDPPPPPRRHRVWLPRPRRSSRGAWVPPGAAAHARPALYVPDQFSFLMSGGLGGLACAALGSALMLSAALHDEWRAFDDIETAARDGSEALAGEGRREALALWVRAQWDRV